MLFNSLDFAIFLPLVFATYWLLKERKAQNIFLVIASYVFYGWWDYRFLSLIFISTITDYVLAQRIADTDEPRSRKIYLWASIAINIGILGFFKYYNFFIDSFDTAFSWFGMAIETRALSIVLPVGISFYTFQTMSYTIDVYRKKMSPTNDFISFATFVCFFPQLVAGPIERATKLLPQFYEKRKFQYAEAVDGMRQLLWGLFKKVVIADNCAIFANNCFDHPDQFYASTLILGVVFFAFQIYCDFSGYSDIAIGTARLFGFKLSQNFAYPYFSRDIAEFWRRWHISLSTWFRDYVYIPLGGSRGSRAKSIRNIFVIFIVSGFWHGANWTFIIWGLIHALFFIPLFIGNRNRIHVEAQQGRWLPSPRELLGMMSTFALVCLAWVFFRAASVEDAFYYLSRIFNSSTFGIPQLKDRPGAILSLGFIGLLLIIEWIGRAHPHPLHSLDSLHYRGARWAIYILIISTIGLFMNTHESPFIYFQF